ncbi:MAG TPA: AAA family ATPase [Acidimicrobiia bacterium]|jgi:class 3 adenylate cyclase/tetratricopeptide (TPR) repeat protein|nr:AAA family ATPase [Acidimicrobiia bacterium]
MSTSDTTILFTDTEASTEFLSVRGDEMAVALGHVHEEIVREVVTKHGGRVIASTGDGYLSVFSSCVTGVRAALDIRGRLREYNASHPDATLPVRMGLNAGPVIEEGGDVHGLAVHAAARVTAKARTGQVLVSEAVRAEASSCADWTFVYRGLFWLKGLQEQWRLYEATSGEVADQAPPLESRSPFVDRDNERAVLRQCVDRANEGEGGLVVVTGSAGVGKTRFVEEIGAEAQARGLRFLVGRCHETSRGDPYVPVVEVLEAVQRRLSPEAFRDIIGEHAGEMARLLPNLRRQYPDIPPPAELPGDEERRYLFVTAQEVLARVGAARPVVILVDDLQWADEPSLLLIEYLATKLRELPILIATTYTREEVSASSPLHEMLTKLHRRHLVQSIVVDELGEADVALLLTAVGESPPPPALVQTLYEATRGNPFFLEEVVHQLVEQGRLLAGGRWRELGDIDLEVPESLRLAIESRLEHLQANTRHVLALASLVGRDFGFELLDVLADLSEDELIDAVDEAERARLITSVAEGDEVRFAFAHELIRHTLLNELSLTRRQRLHGRVADALEQVHAGSLGEHASAVAYHLERAGRWADSDRTIRFLVMAGDRALEAAAYSEALRHFARALSLLPEDDLTARASVLEQMGTAERSLGHLDDALALWREALDAFEELNDASSVARLCLDAAVQVAWWRGGSQAAALVDQGLAALGDSPGVHHAGLLALSGRIASHAGSYERGEELLEQALKVAREHDDDRVLGLALYSRAAHKFAYYQHQETIDAGLESVEHLRRAGDLWNLANVLGYIGASLGWLGRFEEAAEIGKEGEALARRLGNWSAYVFAEQSQSFRDVGSHPAPAVLERRGHHALELGKSMGFPWLSSIGQARIGLAAFWRGRWDDALWRFEEAARLEVRGASGGHVARLFLVHAHLGDRARAIELIDQARPDFPSLGRSNSEKSWGVAAAAVEAFTILGEAEEAAALYRVMVELAATGSLMRSWDYRLLATLEGMSAACAREWDRAEAHFDEALRLSLELPMRLEALDARRFYAQMLVARGRSRDLDRAREHLARAAAGYVAFEMPRHEAMANAILADS